MVTHYTIGSEQVACGRNNHNITSTNQAERVTCKNCLTSSLFINQAVEEELKDASNNKPVPDESPSSTMRAGWRKHNRIFDTKADGEMAEAILFLSRGQGPFGEWFKKLGPKDLPPRGKCAKFFAAHRHILRSA